MVKAKRTAKDALAHARALLERSPLVDGHNDLPFVMHVDRDAKGDVAAYDLARVHQKGDTDIPRLREGQVAAQFWASFIPTNSRHPGRRVLELIDIVHRMNALHPDVFLPATKARDILKAKRLGKIASFLTVEGGVGLENALSPLRIWHAAGARLMTLCHNETLDWVDSATDRARHGGLTAFGRQVVLELNRLGMIVDCAHVSHDVMRQVLDVSRAPVIFSHSNAYALCDHPRNVPDDVLARVPANGGLVMVTFVPDFISQRSRDWMRPFKDDFGKTRAGIDMDAAVPDHERQVGNRPRATLAELCDHIEYLAHTVGVDHLGIGSDFFGGPTPDGLESVARFPQLLAELIRRGWSDAAVTALAGRNFIRVFGQIERIGEDLRKVELPRLGRIEDYDTAA